MQIYHSFFEIERPHASVGVVGAFDGVHLGHQQLLRAAVDDAYARGAPSVVITFFPNPRVVLGRAPALYLTLPDEKARQMHLVGIDMLIELAFTRETIQTPAAEFVRLMVEHLRLVSLWIGPDFALGNKRQGDAAYLREQGGQYGFMVNVMSPVSAGVEAVSSTRIRAALARGDIHDANLCLGRRFQVNGALIDAGIIQAPAQHALPAAGEYLVEVCGEQLRATVLDGEGERQLRLPNPPRCEPGTWNSIVVEFIG
jgi:riboflavin kinase / FMN adenylyltransferase